MADGDEALRELLRDAAELNARSPLVAKVALLIARSHLVEIAKTGGPQDSEIAKAIELVDAAIDVVAAAVDKALAAEHGGGSTES